MATNLKLLFLAMNAMVLMAMWIVVKESQTERVTVTVKPMDSKGIGLRAEGVSIDVSLQGKDVRKTEELRTSGNGAVAGRPENNLSDPPLVLLWNSFFSVWHYGLGFKNRTGRIPLEHCDVRCDYTVDKSLFDQSAAIIIHGRNKFDKFPSTRQPWQRVVFFLLEPPAYDPPYHHLNNVVNTTMTFRRDSDVYIATSRYVLLDKWKPTPKDYVERNYAKGKSKKGVFWMVSNCHPKSKRDRFAKHLNKHINIDIYGKCATGRRFTCDDFTCTKEANKYMFHIAFENSLCKDYAQKILKPYDSIPIVMGGENYSAVLPPNSYVDIKDFGSPKALADRLHAIAKNDTWFNSFFDWRKHYETTDFFTNTQYRRHCKLCKALVHKTLSPTKVYSDMHSWWHKDACWSPQVFYPRLKSYF